MKKKRGEGRLKCRVGYRTSEDGSTPHRKKEKNKGWGGLELGQGKIKVHQR